MTLRFYKRGNKLSVSVSTPEKRYRLSTGINIYPHQELVDNIVFGKGARKTNDLLQIEKQRILNLIDKNQLETYEPIKEFATDDSTMLSNLCKKFIIEISNPDNRKSPAQNTILTYKSTVSQFLKFGRDIDLSKFVIESSMTIQQKEKITAEWESFFMSFENWLNKRELKPRSIYHLVKNIMVIVKHYAKKYYWILPNFSQQPPEDKAVLVLPPNFITTYMQGKDFEFIVHRYVWEVCAVILITSLRLGDALSLTLSDFDADFEYIRKKNKKTGSYTQIPLPKRLSEILKYNAENYNRVYCMTPNQTLIYENIKDLFYLFEECHTDIINHEGERVPLYTIVHPHMLRKTAITNMLYNGVDERHVKFASGHKNNSRSFEKYVGFIESKYHNDIKKYYDKIE